MRVQIKPTQQIQRVNNLKNRLEALKGKDATLFSIRPNENAWCGAEVLKHMIVAQEIYVDKINGALSKLKSIETEVESLRTKRIPSFLIKRFPPIDGEIRFKMKTSKQFKPMLEPDQLDTHHINGLISEMDNSLDQLIAWIERTRFLDVLPLRFNSAVGPIVRFNVSEACEFILCHNERHFHQLERTLKAIN